ncbi:MAG: riboflavin synthase [Ignavibacteriales bacterium]|nr:riboflavin synthase [Ignavibacteriales bacterium]
MFTGLVEEIGRIVSIKKMGDGLEFVIEARKVLQGIGIDNSICVNGVCLTVVKKKKSQFIVQVVKETLNKTNLGDVKVGKFVNLERSVRLHDRLGGHLVQGHVDTTGTVKKVKVLESSWMYTIAFPKEFRKYLISVGSISVDGTSLTVARLTKQEMTIAIIPYTYKNTVFQFYQAGSKVNLEFDVIGKYIESIITYTGK